MSTHDRTISLEERMDAQLHEFGYTSNQEEPYSSSLPRQAVRGAAAATLVGGAGLAYKNRGAIKTGAKDIARQGVEKTAGGVDALGEQMRKRAWKASANNSLKGVADSRMVGGLAKGAEVAGGLGKKIRGISKFLSAGEIHAITHLAERIANLELEAEDDLIDFADYGEQRSKLAVGMAGAAGGNYVNAIPALRAQASFQKAGHVYRKRDAFEDSLKGSVVGGGTTVH